MPYYEYKCESCGKVVERKMSIKDEHPQHLMVQCSEPETTPKQLTYCPFVRMVSKSSFQLAGSGWARDGYRSN